MNAFNYTTHSKQVLGDLHTPVSIYLKVRDTVSYTHLTLPTKA